MPPMLLFFFNSLTQCLIRKMHKKYLLNKLFQNFFNRSLLSFILLSPKMNYLSLHLSDTYLPYVLWSYTLYLAFLLFSVTEKLYTYTHVLVFSHSKINFINFATLLSYSLRFLLTCTTKLLERVVSTTFPSTLLHTP